MVFWGAPLPQEDLGPLQGIDQVGILAPVTRQSRTLRVADQIARDLDKAWSIAEGDGGTPGPVDIEIPTDVLRQTVPPACVLDGHMAPKWRSRVPPDAALVAKSAECLRTARRPQVMTGRGARGAGAALTRLLDASGAVYLDTQESRGLVDGAHAMMIALYSTVQWTKIGRAMRAVSEDKEVAAVMGINVDRTIALTFALGGISAGAAGYSMRCCSRSLTFLWVSYPV